MESSFIEIWRIDRQKSSISTGKKLRIELLKPAKIVWNSTNDQTIVEEETINTGIGIYYLDIPAQNPLTVVIFSILWIEPQELKNEK